MQQLGPYIVEDDPISAISHNQCSTSEATSVICDFQPSQGCGAHTLFTQRSHPDTSFCFVWVFFCGTMRSFLSIALKNPSPVTLYPQSATASPDSLTRGDQVIQINALALGGGISQSNHNISFKNLKSKGRHSSFSHMKQLYDKPQLRRAYIA